MLLQKQIPCRSILQYSGEKTYRPILISQGIRFGSLKSFVFTKKTAVINVLLPANSTRKFFAHISKEKR
jgi:hypothetical protein